MFGKKTLLTIIINIFIGSSNVESLSENLTVGELGNLIGKKEVTLFSGRTIYAFRGIPYAEAPIGDLRFRPPVKITNWNGTLDAREYGSRCPQNSGSTSPLESVDEDCLTLNVYVPETEEDGNSNSKPLPVMIWIHGGTFMGGYAAIYEPHYLLEENVILVVTQFRLGPLGLLCLQTEEIPGNVQFLDQIMSMQWVQDNIVYFGGDKDRVTLIGQSSGAASVNLHQFSRLSRGLFHQAIIQSGSAFAPWVMDYNPLRTAENIGAIVGCRQSNRTELAACFKSLDVKTLLDGFDNYLRIYTIQGLDSIGGHRAVIQTAGTEKFLEEDPRDLMERGEFNQVPMIGGATKHDGSYFVQAYYYSFFLPLGIINDREFLQYNLTSFVVKTFGIDDYTGGISHTLIKAHYEDEDVGDFYKMVPGLTDITSVFAFKSGVFEMMQKNSRLKPSYLYTFSYFANSMRSQNSNIPFELGVGHSGELRYIFPLINDMSEEDLTVVKMMVSMWTSFATNGVPVADGYNIWKPMSEPFGPYLIIEEELRNGTNYLDEYTIARKEGMTYVERSSANYKMTPNYIFTILLTILSPAFLSR